MSGPDRAAFAAAAMLGACIPAPAETSTAVGPNEASDPAPAAAQVEVAPPPVAAVDPSPDPGPRLPDGAAIIPCAQPPAGMACIPGGPFTRGSDDLDLNARPAATVHLQTYYMDVFEVTNAEYKECKRSGECPRGGPLYNDFSRARQPIVGVNWFAAVAYCEAQGKRLPTEAQWEKAARGPDGALHPWGDEPSTCERAVIQDRRGRSCGVKKKKEHPDKGRTFEVGTRPPGVYGLHDMMGNAWEWVYDWATPDYAACGEACAGVEPLGPCRGAETCPGHDKRIVRGGSWYWPASYATGIHRRSHYPINEISDFHHFGFRCAASVEQARALVAAPENAEAPPAP